MENSTKYNKNKHLFNDGTSQESGWTKYFNDFFENNKEEKVSFPLEEEISCLLSDASSLQVKKNSTNNGRVGRSPTHRNCYKRLICSSKKRKTKGTKIEDAFEDTASSPINSSNKEQESGSRKVDERNEFEFDGRKIKTSR